ncbi:16S rRNA processing protein RimM [Helicobacter apodemus]|uniref:Ribosome maturation factor RimM n=1 Tax=Helicobacter apodemus TaxID=135569 RepID=A0A4U8UES0_9HELI|nr:ribosome maturation factor RimM [Helicobacter apodemus]TLE15869.1 16S rRNA processing protein RimM [Helicobacter apodemus]
MKKSIIQKDWVSVGKVGKSVGVKGKVLLHLLSDFPETLQKDISYFTKNGELTIEAYDPINSIAKFVGIDSRESAKTITNLILYTTQEATKQYCLLREEEYFWFDIIGSFIVENGEVLGRVQEVERFCKEDFLWIQTSNELQKQSYPKYFLIPYTKRYILKVEASNPKNIHTQFCKDILENS